MTKQGSPRVLCAAIAMAAICTVFASKAQAYPATGGNGWYYGVWRVTYAGIDNSSGIGAGYDDYTGLPAAHVIPGDSGLLTIWTSDWGANWRRVNAWIDWNQDGDFTDAGEHLLDLWVAVATDPHTVMVTVPTNAAVGTTRLRIAASDWTQDANGGISQWGEAEDYSVTVLPGLQVYNTIGASEVLTTSANLRGNLVLTNGLSTSVYVYWGLIDQATNAMSWDHVTTIANCAPGAFVTNVTGLLTWTNYYYRCYASNSSERAWAPGSSKFTTREPIPTITNAVPLTGYTTAQLKGALTNPGSTPSDVYVYWGDNDGVTTTGNWDYCVYAGTFSDIANVSAAVSGLSRQSTNYYRFFATNSYSGAWAPATMSFIAFPTAASYPPLTQDGWYFDIYGVTFAGINNTSGEGPSYMDYTALPAAVVTRGDSNLLTIATSDFGTNPRWISAWIDWNQDCDFSETNELVLNVYVANPLETPHSVMVSIPTNAVVDTTRMRVIVSWADPVNGSIGSITATNNGEAEDYSVKVLSALQVYNTIGATNVMDTWATLRGNLVVSSGVANVGIYWGLYDRGTNAAAWDHVTTIASCPAGAFATNVTGLLTWSNYFYRCYASNSEEQTWAPASSSFTPRGPSPTITNQAPTHLGYTSAQLNGRLTWPGAAPSDVCVFWGTTDGGLVSNAWDHCTHVGTFTDITNVSLAVSGLTRQSICFYRFYATNAAGYGWAPAVKSFMVFPNAASYPPLAQDGWYFDILRVTFTNINNVTGDGPGPYNDYSMLPAAQVKQGDSVLLTVETTTGGPNPRWVSAWIDWNQDFDFSETNELALKVYVGPTVSPHSAMVSVPANATLDTTRMRVIISWWEPTDGSMNGNGEAEDYSVHVLQGAGAPDGDTDGMPDWWETQFGLNPASSNDAASDPDGDGIDNMHEYVADTNPTDSNSVLEVSGVIFTNGQLKVSWAGGTNTSRYLEYTTALTGTWSSVYTDSRPTPTTNSYSLTPPDNQGFYRIRAVKQ